MLSPDKTLQRTALANSRVKVHGVTGLRRR
jgi:hypothetical protein